MFLVEAVWRPRFWLPWALFGTLRPLVVPVFDVVADGQDDLVCDKALSHQVHRQGIRHLPGYKAGLLPGVGLLKDLAGGEAVFTGAVGFDVPDGTALKTPGVVNEKFCADPEELVEQVFAVKFPPFPQGAPGNIPHGV